MAQNVKYTFGTVDQPHKSTPLVKDKAANAEFYNVLSDAGLIDDSGLIRQLHFQPKNSGILQQEDEAWLNTFLAQFPDTPLSQARALAVFQQELQKHEVAGNVGSADRIRQANIVGSTTDPYVGIVYKSVEQRLEEAKASGVEDRLSAIAIRAQVKAQLDDRLKINLEELKVQFPPGTQTEDLFKSYTNHITGYSEQLAETFNGVYFATPHGEFGNLERFRRASSAVASSWSGQSQNGQDFRRDITAKAEQAVDAWIAANPSYAADAPGIKQSLVAAGELSLSQGALPIFAHQISLDHVLLEQALDRRLFETRTGGLANIPIPSESTAHGLAGVTPRQDAQVSLALFSYNENGVLKQAPDFVPIPTEEHEAVESANRIILNLEKEGYTLDEGSTRGLYELVKVSRNPVGIWKYLFPSLKKAAFYVGAEPSEFQKTLSKFTDQTKMRRFEEDLMIRLIARTVGRKWFYAVEEIYNPRTGKLEKQFVNRPWRAFYNTITLQDLTRGIAKKIEGSDTLSRSLGRLKSGDYIKISSSGDKKIKIHGLGLMNLDFEKDFEFGSKLRSYFNAISSKDPNSISWLKANKGDIWKARAEFDNITQLRELANLLRRRKNNGDRDRSNWVDWAANVVRKTGWVLLKRGFNFVDSKLGIRQFADTQIAKIWPTGKLGSIMKVTGELGGLLTKGVPGGFMGGAAISLLLGNPGYMGLGALIGGLGKGGVLFGGLAYLVSGGDLSSVLAGNMSGLFYSPFTVVGGGFRLLTFYQDLLESATMMNRFRAWSTGGTRVPALLRGIGQFMVRTSGPIRMLGWGGLSRPSVSTIGVLGQYVNLFKIPIVGPIGTFLFLTQSLGWGVPQSVIASFFAGFGQWALTTYLPFKIENYLNVLSLTKGWSGGLLFKLFTKNVLGLDVTLAGNFGTILRKVISVSFKLGGILGGIGGFWAGNNLGGPWVGALFVPLGMALGSLLQAILGKAGFLLNWGYFLGLLIGHGGPIGLITNLLFTLPDGPIGWIAKIVDIVIVTDRVWSIINVFRSWGAQGWSALGQLIKNPLSQLINQLIGGFFRRIWAGLRYGLWSVGVFWQAAFKPFLWSLALRFAGWFTNGSLTGVLTAARGAVWTVLRASWGIVARSAVWAFGLGVRALVGLFAGASLAALGWLIVAALVALLIYGLIAFVSFKGEPVTKENILISVTPVGTSFGCNGKIPKNDDPNATQSIKFQIRVLNNTPSDPDTGGVKIAVSVVAKPSFGNLPLPIADLVPSDKAVPGTDRIIINPGAVETFEHTIENFSLNQDTRVTETAEALGIKDVRDDGSGGKFEISGLGSCSINIGNPVFDTPTGYPVAGKISTPAFKAGSSLLGYHGGGAVDIASHETIRRGASIRGAFIYTTHEGVAYAGPYDPDGYGIYVRVVGSSFVTYYAHLESAERAISLAGVNGVRVTAGCLIGRVDATGNSSGSDPNHLHYEVRRFVGGREFPFESSMKDVFKAFHPKILVTDIIQENEVNTSGGDCLSAP